MGVLAVSLTGYDDRVEDGRALAGIGMADKQPVLLADGRRSDGILDQIIVEARFAVAQVRSQRLPVVEQVRASPAETGLGQRAFVQGQDEPP